MQESPHHGDRWFKEAAEQGAARERIAALVGKVQTVQERMGAPLGATNAHPDGALTPDDEGEIRFGVTAEAGRVVLAFGKSVQWVGMPPRYAIDLANALIHWAKNARLQSGGR